MNKKILLLLATLAIGSGAVYFSQFYPEYAEIKKLEGLLERKQRYVDMTAYDELEEFPAERLRVLAEKGNAAAQYQLAKVYYDNEQKEFAQKWFKKAAEQNYAAAYVSLDGNKQENLEAAAKLGSLEAKFFLANRALIDGDNLSGVMLLRESAEADYPRSQAELGDFYFYGKSSLKADWGEAAKWFDKVYYNIKVNHTDDQFLFLENFDIYRNFSTINLLGIGVAKNENKAIELIEKCHKHFSCGDKHINDLTDLKLDIISRTDLPNLPEIQQAVESLKEELVLSKDPNVLIGLGKLEKDKTKAKQYFGDACDLRSQEGCDKYRELNQQEEK